MPKIFEEVATLEKNYLNLRRKICEIRYWYIIVYLSKIGNCDLEDVQEELIDLGLNDKLCAVADGLANDVFDFDNLGYVYTFSKKLITDKEFFYEKLRTVENPKNIKSKF